MERISARIIPLEGVLNARELGGLPLRNGRRVRRGCLIRAGRLSGLTARDRAVLETTWAIRDVVDLRDSQEVAEHPDQPLEGALIWHCTSGKDRTGLTCALLLWVLGASWHTILEDCLLTNRQTAAYREDLCDRMRRRGADPEAIQEMRTLESVDSGYLASRKSAIADTYGSIDCFLEEHLGLTPDVQNCLREKYTVELL